MARNDYHQHYQLNIQKGHRHLPHQCQYAHRHTGKELQQHYEYIAKVRATTQAINTSVIGRQNKLQLVCQTLNRPSTTKSAVLNKTDTERRPQPDALVREPGLLVGCIGRPFVLLGFKGSGC